MAQEDRVAAQVFLRSVSGRSVRDLGEGTAPADLGPYRPTPAAREEARRYFEGRGFRVFLDEAGLTMSVEAPPRLFRAVFGTPADRASAARVTQDTRLPVPAELGEWVEEIHVLPPPELHGI